MSLLKLEDLSVTYGSNNNAVEALKCVNLEVEQGAFLTITGKSGCGKTTLLNVLGGILKPSSGTYYFEGENVLGLKDKALAAFRNQNIGFVVQHFALIQDRTVRDNIALPLIYRRIPRKSIDEKVNEALESLEILDKKDKYPYELSGGQSQRVAIARAIVANPKLIIADEPTGALDEETGYKILNILKKLNNEGKTMIMVTHDTEIAEMGNYRIHMRDGIIQPE